jgi:hypothetical protein
MKRESELISIAQRQGMLVSTVDVLTLVSADTWNRALDDGLWLRVAPGWYRHAATPLTFEMQVRAGAAWLGGRGALFGSSALRWLGIEIAEPRESPPRTMSLRSIPNWMSVHTSEHWTNDEVTHLRCARTAARATSPGTAPPENRGVAWCVRLRRTA